MAKDKIHQDWLPILNEYFNSIDTILSSISNYVPDYNDVFNAFMLSPHAIKVVIIGQDPYPTIGVGHGLAFSTLNGEIPGSLRNIFANTGATHRSSNLSEWMYQGVFLLNAALTTVRGTPDAHSAMWNPIICNIIRDLSKLHPMTFMLWGNRAKQFSRYIDKKCTVLEWFHPSPLCQKFHGCDHFARCPQINWSTGNLTRIYTDGGAKLVEECASFAVYVGTGSLKKVSVYGQVWPNEYDERLLPNVEVEMKPTSQRGELLAMCYALKLIEVLMIPPPIEIITDSRNTLMTLKEWFDSRKPTAQPLKNLDLVHYAHRLYKKIKPILIHTNSHQPDGHSEHSKFNNIADKLTKIAINLDDFDVHVSRCEHLNTSQLCS